MDTDGWFRIGNEASVQTPALLVYTDCVVANIERMIAIAGGPDRLRPHVKTHKLPEILDLQLTRGITRFKCSTIAEAELVAMSGGRDVLLAYQPVGPNATRLAALARAWPAVAFSTLVDNLASLEELSRAAVDAGVRIGVLVDLDVGMHRTGIEPGPDAVALYARAADSPGLTVEGLHAYDGHVRQPDLSARARVCDAAFAPVLALRDRLAASGLAVPRVVAGGTPTFPVHARRSDVELSPGTCVLWDAGYGTTYDDLDFEYAALVMSRVVSKPGGSRLCLDLGHKAIASENPHPRVLFLNLPEARAVGHSEEHLVVETPAARNVAVGDVIYGIPWHICPTVALHGEAICVERGRAGARWPVVGRARRLTY